CGGLIQRGAAPVRKHEAAIAAVARDTVGTCQRQHHAGGRLSLSRAEVSLLPLLLRGGGSCNGGASGSQPPSPTLPRKGEGRRKCGPASGPIVLCTASGILTHSHLRGPALRESARAAGARRAIAAELIEPDIEIDAVAAEPALGEHSGNFRG